MSEAAWRGQILKRELEGGNRRVWVRDLKVGWEMEFRSGCQSRPLMLPADSTTNSMSDKEGSPATLTALRSACCLLGDWCMERRVMICNNTTTLVHSLVETAISHHDFSAVDRTTSLPGL